MQAKGKMVYFGLHFTVHHGGEDAAAGTEDGSQLKSRSESGQEVRLG